MSAAVKREQTRENEVIACAVLMGHPMPDWSVAEILAVHFRMHKAEGVLFREVLAHAAKECGLKLVEIPKQQLMMHASTALRSREPNLVKKLAIIGKSVGPPWGKDQKDAALAAMVGLEARSK
jgi:hypothetical protein